MLLRRLPRNYLVGALLLAALLVLVARNWIKIHEAVVLVQDAQPGWLVAAVVAVVAGYLCAGQVYGRVLATLGYRARTLWLSAAALVTILTSQAIPAGSVASYAFLTASLRRRGIPHAGVALVASLELLSWMGAMLLLFGYGLLYLVITTGAMLAPRACYSGLAAALVVLSSSLFVGSRPHATLHDWALRIKGRIDRIFGSIWPDSAVLGLVDEFDANRRVLMAQPGKLVLLICLQVSIFALHSLALLAILYSLNVVVSPQAVLAAYGLALIVSTFTVLPGGGGAVEAALTLALSALGVPPEAALGATILFRLCNFWLLLPLGAVCYRVLMRQDPPDPVLAVRLTEPSDLNGG
jgi:uncharacterized protein (TIRG00374 family)